MNDTSTTDETIRRLFQGPEADHAPGEGCIPPGRVWDAVHGEIAPSGTGEIVDHVAVCPTCTETWRMAVALLDSGDLDASETPGRARSGRLRPRSWSRWVPYAAAAALAIVVIGLAVIPTWRRVEEPARIRSWEELSIRSLVEDSEPLDRARCVLRWTPVAENARYHVKVATERVVPLASQGGLDRTEFTVPEQALADLPPGASIVWQVRASLPDGRKVVSETFVNQLE